MNTTTNTRGVSEAMYRHAIQAWIDRERTHGHDLPAQLLAALEAALSAEPAAQGEAVGWIDEYGNVFPLGAHSVNGKLSWQEAHKRNWRPLFTTPPAQPSERVPDPETACAMWIKPDTTEAESNAFLAGARAMLAATPAAPAEEGDGKEGVR